MLLECLQQANGPAIRGASKNGKKLNRQSVSSVPCMAWLDQQGNGSTSVGDYESKKQRIKYNHGISNILEYLRCLSMTQKRANAINLNTE
jgi:hypothetical protein